MSILSGVTAAPADPILGLTEAFNADTRATKVNLGVGVYQDATGKLPLLECVRRVEGEMGDHPVPRGYLPIDGLVPYKKSVAGLVLGADSQAYASGRVVMVETLSGTGTLKVGADFLNEVTGGGPVLISDPSWENHQALFTRAGLKVSQYRYYNAEQRGIDFEGMLEDLRAAAPGTVVVLHPCCHNPTGYDLVPAQWDRVLEVCRERELVPFVDMAYQGFSRGVDEDGYAARLFAESGLTAFISVSFSKTFSLYGERVGALAVICSDADEAKRALSRIKIVVRTNYSNPPTHGARVVTTVLDNPELRALWETELAGMRDRIRAMRVALVAGLQSAGVSDDVSYITRQAGMFSYSGLSKDQMVRLRQEYGVYGTDKGRICVAALNDNNIDYVAESIAAVL